MADTQNLLQPLFSQTFLFLKNQNYSYLSSPALTNPLVTTPTPSITRPPALTLLPKKEAEAFKMTLTLFIIYSFTIFRHFKKLE